jgi:hypothetical protein
VDDAALLAPLLPLALDAITTGSPHELRAEHERAGAGALAA